jgi:hypothetical protein
MAEFQGFESFSAYVSTAGFVCIKQCDVQHGHDVTVMFPVSLWPSVVAEISADIESCNAAQKDKSGGD